MQKTNVTPHLPGVAFPFNSEDTDLFSLQQVLNSLSMAVMVTDNTLNIEYCNQSFREIFDLQPSSLPFTINLPHRQFSNISHCFAQPQMVQQLCELNIAENKKSGGKLIALQNGKYLSLCYTPMQVNNRSFHLFTFNGCLHLSGDTEEIITRQNLYQDILTHLPSDIAALSTDHKYLFVNPKAVANEEVRKWLIGKTDYEYCEFYEKDVAQATNRTGIYKKVIDSKQPIEWEEQTTGNNGSQEHHLRKMSPVLDDEGEIKFLIGYGLNITERKKIEDLIQLSEKRYRDLFNYSQAIICTHDLDGNFLTVNPALCISTGYSEAEIIGQNLSGFLPEEDRRVFHDIYLSSIATESKVKGVFRVEKKDGGNIYLLYENFKVEEAGNLPYIIGFAQDITERINAERELKAAKKITEETALLKERFLANMSHEIRTPMNGILGISNLLQKTNLDEQQKKYLGIINDSAQNLLTIINDILDLEKIAAGEVNIECIPFDLVQRTRSILSLFDHAAEAKGINFRFQNQLGHSMLVNGDPTRYNQILNNIISNAIKFTSIGSVDVSLAVVTDNDENVTIKVSVTDTGIGMEESSLKKIFEPFTQAYAETTRKYGGTGLGLAITKNLVEIQGGTIDVKSKLGYGSKFSFTITYGKAEAIEPVKIEKEPIKPVQSELGPIKVLLAEDNEVNQLLARSILMFWGAECQAATTGNEVLELLKENDFDIVLMDIQMPEKNGLDATLDIRNLEDKKKRNIPIIALTANALKGEEKKYIEVGMDDFLTKPFKEKELYEVISRVMKNEGSFGRKLLETDNKLTTSIMIDAKREEHGNLFDMKSLDEVSRGNKDFIVTLAKIFLNTIPKNCTEMAEAAEAKNWDRVSNLAHKLKPTIDTMNIKLIKQDIRAIEINAKNKADLASIPRQIEKVCDIIDRTAFQLREHFCL